MRNTTLSSSMILSPRPFCTSWETVSGSETKWIWRCHIDLTDAQPDVWAKLQEYIRLYDAAEFSMEEFIIGGYGGPTAVISAPGIDPLDEKNVPLGLDEAARVLEPFGVDSKRPIMAQVSRFDPWKDPLGVVDAYRLVKKRSTRNPADHDRADGGG